MTLDDYLKKARKEFPDLQLKEKSKSWLMKAIDIALKIITFGQMTGFMTGFTTTLGQNIYTSLGWSKIPEADRIRVVRHELVHFRQQKTYGRFLFSFLYLFFPLPIFFAYYRRKFEQEAYEESMRAAVEDYGIRVLRNPTYKKSMVDHFTTSQYFWTWVIRSQVERWYDDAVKRIQKGL